MYIRGKLSNNEGDIMLNVNSKYEYTLCITQQSNIYF